MISSPFFRPFAPPIEPPLSPLDNILAHFHPLFPDNLPQSHFALPAFSCLDFPSSPSDTCSSISADVSPSPVPHAIRVVCDVPLLAPRPLPYHSPTFLQFDLPDTDEDLSHPPYTHRPAKRKRDITEDPPVPQPQSKRRPGTHSRRSRLARRPWDASPPAHHPHRSGNHPFRP